MTRSGNRLRVHVRDLSINRWLDLPADLVPISMSVAPAEGTEELATMLRVPLGERRVLRRGADEAAPDGLHA